MNTSARSTCCLFLAIAVLAIPSAFPQGALTPPGVPSPTMKTLQQIEPRIDLQNAPASAVTTSDANWHFIITQPGSYYLAQNFLVTKPTSSDNRIEGNNVADNDRGIQIDVLGNLILRNSASGNTTANYDIAANNNYGVILDLTATGAPAVSGNSAAGTLTTTTNPWANFTY